MSTTTNTRPAVDPQRLQDLHGASLRLLGLLTIPQAEDSLLKQAIESLVQLIKARYGAIGILDEAGQLQQFVYTGIAPEAAARIGRLPEGKGLLGAVIHENHALRLDDMSRDPRAAGFPPHHPPMKSLLAVPVSHEGQVFGRVYLSEKLDGTPFTDEDEQLVTRFADALALTLRFHRAEAERHRTHSALQNVAHAVSAVTGQEFFRTLVLDLAKALDVDYAFVGRLADDRRDAVETVAVNAKGLLVDNFTYELKGTPCLNVVGKAPCQYPRQVQQRFPDDRLLKEMGIESYVGCPLFGANGQPLGLLVVMDSKPMRDPLAMQALLQICAARAAAELERRHTEEALRASEEDLRALAENANDGILVNSNGQHVFANQRLADLLGYTLEELRHTGMKELVHPDEYDKVASRFRARMADEAVPAQYETVFVAKDGAAIPVEVNAAKTVWQGQPAGLVFVRDIRARKRAEAEMLKLVSAVEQTADAVVVTNADGFIEYVNPAFEQHTGYRREEVIGRTPAVVKSGKHDKAFYRGLWGALKRGEVFRAVFVNRRKNGELFYEEKTITPLKDEAGNITHFVSAGRDITERKRAEEALARTASEWTYSMDFVEDALYLIDLDDRVVRANRAFYRLTGLTPEQTLGHDITALMHPHGESVPCPVCAARRERRDAMIVMEAGHPDNPTGRPIEVTVHIVRDREGAPVSVLMTIHDLTRARQIESELRHSQARLLEAQRMAHLGNWDWNLVDGTLAWSDEIFRIFGYVPQQFTPTAERFIEAVHPDDRARVEAAARGALENGEVFRVDFRILRPDGATRIVHEEAEVVRGSDGVPLRMRGTTQDITEAKQAEDQLSRLGRILDDSSNEIYVFCAESLRFIQVNRGAQHNLGYTMHELKDLTPLDLKPEFTKERFEALIAPLRQGEKERINFTTTHRRKDGSDYPVDVQLQLMRHESPPVFVAIIQDITERKQAEARLSYLAYYDTLTGLPNRARLLERLQQAMLDAGRVNRLVAAMFLDLDRFKVINDTLGHHVGDGLLRAVAARLKGCVRPGDIIARLGGDEFAVVLASVAHVDDVARVARKIVENFAEPYQVEGHELFTTTSIGITLYPFDEQDPEGLLKNADAAMYHAKERGRNNFQFFTAELNTRAERRLKLETALRQALARNELELHYQPQVDTKTGRLTGMEALARWQHPELGNVSPVEFIPVAEETGLILPIGEWVLREACRQTKAWHATKFSFSKMQVAVNISGKQLRQKNFPDLVRQVLDETGLEPRYLDLELTESLLMEDVEQTADAMHMLHDLGVSFSVDDFGTGYSSLSYLKRFPIDILKIDRSFVRDIGSDPNDVAIVKTIIAMARALNMRVIAEGVETYEQLTFLRGQGCDGSQGYYCSLPLAAGEFSALLADWGRIRQGKCRLAPRRTRPGRRRKAAGGRRKRAVTGS